MAQPIATEAQNPFTLRCTLYAFKKRRRGRPQQGERRDTSDAKTERFGTKRSV